MRQSFSATEAKKREMTEIFEATETDKKRAADELNEPEDTSQATTNTKKLKTFG